MVEIDLTTPLEAIQTHRFFEVPSSFIAMEEVAELMGYEEEVEEPFVSIINSELALLPTYTDIEGGFQIFQAEQLTSDYRLLLREKTFHLGKTVGKLLKDTEYGAVFLCTAGTAISDRSKQLMNEGMLMEGYVVDIIGSILVEKVMDILQKELKQVCEKYDFQITNRYSPGYNEWNVSEQHELFDLLPEKFCNVTLSDSALMTPSKSISGIVGIGKEVKFRAYSCSLCSSANCIYRNKNNNKKAKQSSPCQRS